MLLNRFSEQILVYGERKALFTCRIHLIEGEIKVETCATHNAIKSWPGVASCCQTSVLKYDGGQISKTLSIGRVMQRFTVHLPSFARFTFLAGERLVWFKRRKHENRISFCGLARSLLCSATSVKH